MKSDEYKGIRTTSELFEKEGAHSKNIGDHGDFDARSSQFLYYLHISLADAEQIL